MIYLSEIVIRLRAVCPSFQQRVGGTSAFGAIMDAGPTSDLAVPHCFVVPTDEMNITGLDQYIGDDTERHRETFDTIVCVDNSMNRGIGGAGPSSIAPMDQLRDLQVEIERAWNDWVPKQEFDVINFVRGGTMGMDNRYLWHRWTWATDFTRNLDATDDAQVEDTEAQIRWITEGRGTENPGNVDEVYVGKTIYTPADVVVDTPETVSDFFLRSALLPPIIEPAPEVLQAKEDAADVVIEPHAEE